MYVKPPWAIAAPQPKPDDKMRFFLQWYRTDRRELRRVASVFMLNPSREGEEGERGVVDGPTHRRVRQLLSDYDIIRVVNLSPVRASTTEKLAELEAECIDDVRRFKPARNTEEALEWCIRGQVQAVRWALLDAEVAVAAWGGGKRTPLMATTLYYLTKEHGADQRWRCWGTTKDGYPRHPSPLGRLPMNARLERFRLREDNDGWLEDET